MKGIIVTLVIVSRVECDPSQSVAIDFYSKKDTHSGEHQYWLEVTENGCAAKDSEDFPQYLYKIHNFYPNFNQVEYGGRIYDLIALHRYRMQIDIGSALAQDLIFSEDGFELLKFSSGSGTNIQDACLTFEFTRADE